MNEIKENDDKESKPEVDEDLCSLPPTNDNENSTNNTEVETEEKKEIPDEEEDVVSQLVKDNEEEPNTSDIKLTENIKNNSEALTFPPNIANCDHQQLLHLLHMSIDYYNKKIEPIQDSNTNNNVQKHKKIDRHLLLHFIHIKYPKMNGKIFSQLKKQQFIDNICIENETEFNPSSISAIYIIFDGKNISEILDLFQTTINISDYSSTMDDYNSLKIKQQFSSKSLSLVKLHQSLTQKYESPEGSNTYGVGIQGFKNALRNGPGGNLTKFKYWAKNENWGRFHFSHYDWWMFFNDRRSMGQGIKYAVFRDDILEFKKDGEFMSDYRLGVQLVLQSYGWDMDGQKFIEDRESSQEWTGYCVRLLKMLYSTIISREWEVYDSVHEFCVQLLDDGRSFDSEPDMYPYLGLEKPKRLKNRRRYW